LDFGFRISDFGLLTLCIIVFSAFSAFAGAQTCSSPFVCGSNPNCTGGQQADLKLNGQGGLQTFATFSYCDGIKFFKNLSVNATITATNFVGNGANLTNAAGWVKSGSNIFTSGSVAIGCSSFPSGVMLAVNGKIQASEFEIKTTPCSDFVFEKGYKLRSLKEVEQFVTENMHLPEIPSAKEFKEAGSYKVAEMDDLLLRKVEELTLYTIELNKQVEALKAELAKVKGGE